MRTLVGVALCLSTALLATACPKQPQVEDRPSAPPSSPSTAPSQDATSPVRASLAAIERGAPAKVGLFHGATVRPAGGGAPVRLDVPDRENIHTVVAYRGGYLAAVSKRGEYRTRGVVFDEKGRLVRRLDGCVNGPVSSTDGDLVAWISRPCGGLLDLTLWVGPREELETPDREQRLPRWNGLPAEPSAVGEWGVTVQLTDGMRGYPEDVYVAQPATGEVRRVPGTDEVISVSPQGIACCVPRLSRRAVVRWNSLVDLRTNTVLGRSPLIEAWSPDGTEALVHRRGGRWDVVDPDTGSVLRPVRLPAKLIFAFGFGHARWEDADSLLFNVASRYDPVGDTYYSTVLRVTASGGIERVTGVTQGDGQHFS